MPRAARIVRGQVWWAELLGDAGFRPVVIVSRAAGLGSRRNVTVAEVTRVVRSIPAEVPLSQADGMPADCVINTDSQHTIPQGRLREPVTRLNPQKLFALDSALRFSLGLDD